MNRKGVSAPMPPPIDDVKNWMNMFRWIVKLIRDEYEMDESILTRTAALETDCGLMIEQLEAITRGRRREFQSEISGRKHWMRC